MSYANNKKAHFDFEILETLEAGLVLRGGEAYLVGVSIPAWQPANASKSYDPERPRKLLLKEKELTRVTQSTDKQCLTAVALSLYNSGRNIKLSFGIAKGKKKADKRETLKARDVKREIERTLKSQ
jgi:SsrA-binding protein